MSKKTKKSSKKSKSKQKKNTITIEEEYTGDISNFQEFASFYRQRISQKSTEINESKKDLIKNDQEIDVLDRNIGHQNSVGYNFDENVNKIICTCERKLPSCLCFRSLNNTGKASKVLSLKSESSKKSKSALNYVLSKVSNQSSVNYSNITVDDDSLYQEMYNINGKINTSQYKEMSPSYKKNVSKSVNKPAMKCNNSLVNKPAMKCNNSLVNKPAMKCNAEYKKYYEIISGATNKPEKSSLEYLSELAYLDYYKEKIYDTEAVRECCLGYNNCTYDECWIEHCSKCILCQSDNSDTNKCLSCSSCKNTKLDKLNEYLLPNTSTSKTDIKKINQKRSERRKKSDQ